MNSAIIAMLLSAIFFARQKKYKIYNHANMRLLYHVKTTGFKLTNTMKG